MSHPTMGAWIEIFNNSSEHLGVNVSHPTMGAWIEICSVSVGAVFFKSHPTMGAWIEIIVKVMSALLHTTSHPTMGAWIEILSQKKRLTRKSTVAPHDGCVD